MNVSFQHIIQLHPPPIYHIVNDAVCLCMSNWNIAKLSVHGKCMSASHPWWVFEVKET